MDKIKGRTYKKIKVMVSIITVMVFFVTCVLQDAVAIIEIEEQVISVREKEGNNFASINTDTFTIPAHLGEIKQVFKGSNKRFVIHLQDAHSNFNAQNKIADLIDYINKEYGVSIINLEGGEGGYELGVFTAISGEAIRREVAGYFVKKGEINGAEFYAINNPGRISLWGIEDKEIYLKNLNVYRNSLKYKDKSRKILVYLSGILGELKRYIYSPELLRIDSEHDLYKSGNIEFRDYLEFLFIKAASLEVDISTMNDLELLLAAMEMEDEIDFKKANTERDKLILALKETLSKNEIRKLAAKTLDFRTKKISRKVFYNYLFDEARAIGIDADAYPDFLAYAEYIKLYEEIDRSMLIKEMKELEGRIKEKLFRDDAQRELDLLSRNLTVINNIFDIALTKTEYHHFQDNKKLFRMSLFDDFIKKYASEYRVNGKKDINIFEMDVFLKEMIRFYEYSFERDKVFLRNLRFSPVGGGIKGAVLVTGGFHTENLCDLLKMNDISFVSILPKFRNDEGYENPYFDLLAGKKKGVEYMLSSAIARSSMIAIASKLSPILGGYIWGKDDISAFAAAVIVRELLERSGYKKRYQLFMGFKGSDFSSVLDKEGNPIIFGEGDAVPEALSLKRLMVEARRRKEGIKIIDKGPDVIDYVIDIPVNELRGMGDMAGLHGRRFNVNTKENNSEEFVMTLEDKSFSKGQYDKAVVLRRTSDGRVVGYKEFSFYPGSLRFFKGKGDLDYIFTDEYKGHINGGFLFVEDNVDGVSYRDRDLGRLIMGNFGRAFPDGFVMKTEIGEEQTTKAVVDQKKPLFGTDPETDKPFTTMGSIFRGWKAVTEYYVNEIGEEISIGDIDVALASDKYGRIYVVVEPKKDELDEILSAWPEIGEADAQVRETKSAIFDARMQVTRDKPPVQLEFPGIKSFITMFLIATFALASKAGADTGKETASGSLNSIMSFIGGLPFVHEVIIFTIFVLLGIVAYRISRLEFFALEKEAVEEKEAPERIVDLKNIISGKILEKFKELNGGRDVHIINMSDRGLPGRIDSFGYLESRLKGISFDEFVAILVSKDHKGGGEVQEYQDYHIIIEMAGELRNRKELMRFLSDVAGGYLSVEDFEFVLSFRVIPGERKIEFNLISLAMKREGLGSETITNLAGELKKNFMDWDMEAFVMDAVPGAWTPGSKVMPHLLNKNFDIIHDGSLGNDNVFSRIKNFITGRYDIPGMYVVKIREPSEPGKRRSRNVLISTVFSLFLSVLLVPVTFGMEDVGIKVSEEITAPALTIEERLWKGAILIAGTVLHLFTKSQPVQKEKEEFENIKKIPKTGKGVIRGYIERSFMKRFGEGGRGAYENFIAPVWEEVVFYLLVPALLGSFASVPLFPALALSRILFIARHALNRSEEERFIIPSVISFLVMVSASLIESPVAAFFAAIQVHMLVNILMVPAVNAMLKYFDIGLRVDGGNIYLEYGPYSWQERGKKSLLPPGTVTAEDRDEDEMIVEQNVYEILEELLRVEAVLKSGGSVKRIGIFLNSDGEIVEIGKSTDDVSLLEAAYGSLEFLGIDVELGAEGRGIKKLYRDKKKKLSPVLVSVIKKTIEKVNESIWQKKEDLPEDETGEEFITGVGEVFKMRSMDLRKLAAYVIASGIATTYDKPDMIIGLVRGDEHVAEKVKAIGFLEGEIRGALISDILNDLIERYGIERGDPIEVVSGTTGNVFYGYFEGIDQARGRILFRTEAQGITSAQIDIVRSLRKVTGDLFLEEFFVRELDRYLKSPGVTEEGLINIAREKFGLRPGDEVEITAVNNRKFVLEYVGVSYQKGAVRVRKIGEENKTGYFLPFGQIGKVERLELSGAPAVWNLKEEAGLKKLAKRAARELGLKSTDAEGEKDEYLYGFQENFPVEFRGKAKVAPRGYPSVELEFMRIGHLFFMQKGTYERLSPELKAVLKDNVLFVDNVRPEYGKFTILAVIQIMQNDIRDKYVVDMGAGDGILSLVALKLGAVFTDMFEKDDTLEISVKELMEDNGFGEEKYRFNIADIGEFDPGESGTVLDMPQNTEKVVISNIGKWDVWEVGNEIAIRLIRRLGNVDLFIASGYYQATKEDMDKDKKLVGSMGYEISDNGDVSVESPSIRAGVAKEKMYAWAAEKITIPEEEIPQEEETREPQEEAEEQVEAAKKVIADVYAEKGRAALGDVRQGRLDIIGMPASPLYFSAQEGMGKMISRKLRKDYGQDTLPFSYMYKEEKEAWRWALTEMMRERIIPAFTEGQKEDKNPRILLYLPITADERAEIFEKGGLLYDVKDLEEYISIIAEDNMPNDGVIDEVMHIVLGKALLNYERFRKGDFGDYAEFDKKAMDNLIAFIRSLVDNPDVIDIEKDPEIINKILDGSVELRMKRIDFGQISIWKKQQDEMLRSL